MSKPLANIKRSIFQFLRKQCAIYTVEHGVPGVLVVRPVEGAPELDSVNMIIQCLLSQNHAPKHA